MDNKRKVMLKLSGEALSGDKKTGFDLGVVKRIAAEIRPAVEKGVRLAIVIGGGNFWRGRTGEEIERSKSDSIGMLATIMNSIYVSEVFKGEGLKVRVFSSIEIPSLVPIFNMDEVNKAFDEGSIVFFAGGTGHPYFSTDTATLLRAIEIGADEVLLAKAVNGVYDMDPKINSEAKRFSEISISELIERGLEVIDMTASVMAKEHKIALRVFSLNEEGNILKALMGNVDGTIVNAK